MSPEDLMMRMARMRMVRVMVMSVMMMKRRMVLPCYQAHSRSSERSQTFSVYAFPDGHTFASNLVSCPCGGIMGAGLWLDSTFFHRDVAEVP